MWTIHSAPRLLVSRLKCGCEGKDDYFQPGNPTIRTIGRSEITKIWKGFAKLADYPKIAEYIFNTNTALSYREGHKLLIEAKTKEKKTRDEAIEILMGVTV
ncbi:hypothetical protein N7493_008990 [Penicillium malachiteum]|uniref:Uncharacterized protein n=1 Tax=Penicillium malachiteum TaxID=1324776 RepID=A0AAD6HFM2_9EURO|nr:hypothetical protein N7493_008990 [Penicillium malachiteum]